MSVGSVNVTLIAWRDWFSKTMTSSLLMVVVDGRMSCLSRMIVWDGWPACASRLSSAPYATAAPSASMRIVDQRFMGTSSSLASLQASAGSMARTVGNELRCLERGGPEAGVVRADGDHARLRERLAIQGVRDPERQPHAARAPEVAETRDDRALAERREARRARRPDQSVPAVERDPVRRAVVREDDDEPCPRSRRQLGGRKRGDANTRQLERVQADDGLEACLASQRGVWRGIDRDQTRSDERPYDGTVEQIMIGLRRRLDRPGVPVGKHERRAPPPRAGENPGDIGLHLAHDRPERPAARVDGAREEGARRRAAGGEREERGDGDRERACRGTRFA